MKLYIVPGAPNARKVQAVVKHLGLNPEIIQKDFFTGDMKKEDYLAINPNAKTPALVDGALKLWESEAINIYLASEKARNNTVFDSDQRPDIMRWQFWSVSHYNRWLGDIVWERIVKPVYNLGECNDDVVTYAMEFFKPFIHVLENHLNGREYMVGTQWTLADYSIAFMEPFIRSELLPFNLSDYPNVQGLYDRMSNNPYWEATAVPPEKMGRAG